MPLAYVDPCKPYPFMFWNQYDEEEHVYVNKDIKHVIFYDETLYMLQDISNGSDNETLYCSLHIANANVDIYKNVLELLPENIKISFNFSDKRKEQVFIDKIKEQVPTSTTQTESTNDEEDTLAWLDSELPEDDEDEIMPF
jgi:hypothetical protein